MKSPPASKLFRAAGIVSLLYISSRFLGYMREAFLAARFGATHTTDAYVVAQELPTALFAAISLSLLMIFIPVYRQVGAQRGEEAARRLASTVINVVLGLAVLLILIGWVFAPTLLGLMVPGLPAVALERATTLARIMFPVMLCMGVGGVLSALLNANYHFTTPALLPLISNLFVIGALLLVGQPDQIHWVAYAVVIGSFAGAAAQVPALSLIGYRYSPIFDWKSPELRQIGTLVLPVMISTMAMQVQNMVDRYWASGLSEGSISALNYATRLNGLPYGVIGVAVATVLYPKLAQHVADGELTELRETVVRGLRTMSWVLLPMALGLFAFRVPIVQLFFERGAFDPGATAVTAYTVQYLALGIPFFGWQDFLSRSFFVLQDSVTPMWVILGTVVLNIGLNAILVGPFGLGGLAMGTSLAAMCGVGLLFYRLRRRLGALQGRELLGSVALSLLTTAVGIVLGRIAFDALGGLLGGESLLLRLVRLAIGLMLVLVVHVFLGRAVGSRDGAVVFERFGR